MAESKKYFTFIWKVKNFSFCLLETKAPTFLVNEMSGTKWTILLTPNSGNYIGCIACYLQRHDDDNGPQFFELNHELSFLDGDGFALQSEIFLKKLYSKGNWIVGLHAEKDEVHSFKKDRFIPDDILTIRCIMWDSQESITQSGRCFAETCIGTESITIVGIIKKFSSITPDSKNLVSTQSSSTLTLLSSMNLTVGIDGKIVIEMNLVKRKSLCMYRYKIFIRDILGNKTKSGYGEFYNKGPHTIPFTLLKEYLMENKRYYLPNDVLTIECNVTFPTGKITEKIDEPEFGFDFKDTQKMFVNTKETYFSSEEFYSDSFTTMKDDFTTLFKDSVLCDTKLKTATETFSAHIAVLSARSPVFKSMFTSEMKEMTNKCVDIDDLDADTVRQMLLFMYSDTIVDLNYKSAKSLYFAADKYNIVSLKHRCSSFLKQNLLQSNYCEILLLADKHQDNDLKHAVQDYIMKNEEAVLLSEEWKDLEENNSQLTAEVIRTLYVKIRRM